MKKLLLVRHGKSDWGNPQLKDFDRPLNPRGHKNAPEMANRIIQVNEVPDKIISSTALRAITTAQYFAEKWNMSSDQILEKPEIYEANTSVLLKVLNEVSDEYTSVAIFGHNPGFTDFANLLSDADISNIPTCGVVLITFDADRWNEISSGTGTLIKFDYPKSLEED